MSKFFALIEGGEVHPSSNEKVIPAEEFTLLLEADALLEKSRIDSANYLEKTQKEAESIKKTAHEEGFQEGLNRFNEAVVSLENEKKRLRHEMSQMILPLVLKTAKKVVGAELQTNPETIVNIVLQAITPVSQDHYVTIYVNKADKETLEAAKPRLKEKLEQLETLLIKERSDVSVGGCIIETKQSGIINATIENQWRSIAAALERSS